MEIARSLRYSRVGLDEVAPLRRVALLEGKALPVWPVAEDDRVHTLDDREEDVGAKDDAVVHGDRHVALDAHRGLLGDQVPPTAIARG